MRDFLRESGFENLSKQLDDWLNGNLTEQEKADLFVADLVIAARNWVAGKNPSMQRQSANTVLSRLSRQNNDAAGSSSQTVLSRAPVNDQTQTPQFKNWFGDWQAALNATPKRTAKTLDDAIAMARVFVGVPLKNQATSMSAMVSNTNLAKMSSRKAGDKSLTMQDHALAIANIDKLFAHALLDHSHADSKGEPTIKAIHRFMAPMFGANGNLVLVKMTVKETTGPKEPNPIYSVEALEIENQPSVLARGNPDKTGISPQTGLNETVLDLIEKVKAPVSKVVDAQGRPMVVYHGTKANINRFKMGDEGGVFFTTSPQNASEYAGTWQGVGQSDGGNVMPVYLSIKNPYKVSVAQWNDLGSKILSPEDAKANGHDGYMIEGQDGGDTFIAFEPEQITSAIGNNGDFGGTNPDIRLSRSQPNKSVSERADEALAKPSGSAQPIDKLTKTVTKVTGIERLTHQAYDKAAYLLNRITPEQVKAGVVSDYGVPDPVIDRRAMLQGALRVQLRKAGKLSLILLVKNLET